MTSAASTNSQDSLTQNTGLGAALGAPPPDESTRPIRIALQLEARDLPNLDTHGRSDPFVVVYRKVDTPDPSDETASDAPQPPAAHRPQSAVASPDEWVRLGQTETVYNNLNPQWATIFTLDYRFGANSVLRFAIYDRDSRDDDITRHDYIGEVQCTVAQVVLADNQRLEFPIRNQEIEASGRSTGVLTIRGEEQKGDLGETVTFVFAVSGLRKARRPFYVLRRKNLNDSDFAPVVYSEVHQRYSRSGQVTSFKPITKSIARLVNNDQDRELMIEFFNYDRRGQHYRGGNVTFTLRSVRTAIASPGGTASFTLTKRRSNGQIVEAGTLIVRKCEFSIPYSFIDYLHAGVVINTVIAVDMSNSNGDPQIPNSLQYNNPRTPNEYVIALREVGNVLAAYTTTNQFPTFGFGAVLPPSEETSHCFALTGQAVEPTCHGIPGVIEAYYQALNNVAPWEPCKYGPVLEHVVRMAREENERDERTVYTILLLVTDGDFDDFADVANLICGAADVPLSIVIVGVGNSDFIKLERLDGDEERLCSTDGTPCARDIVQFVQFHRHRFNPTQLAKEVLDEIPEQLVSYMRSRSIRPDDIVTVQPQSSPRNRGPYYPDSMSRMQSVGGSGNGVPGSVSTATTGSPPPSAGVHGMGQAGLVTPSVVPVASQGPVGTPQLGGVAHASSMMASGALLSPGDSHPSHSQNSINTVNSYGMIPGYSPITSSIGGIGATTGAPPPNAAGMPGAQGAAGPGGAITPGNMMMPSMPHNMAMYGSHSHVYAGVASQPLQHYPSTGPGAVPNHFATHQGEPAGAQGHQWYNSGRQRGDVE